jgi:hypothetical protein
MARSKTSDGSREQSVADDGFCARIGLAEMSAMRSPIRSKAGRQQGAAVRDPAYAVSPRAALSTADCSHHLETRIPRHSEAAHQRAWRSEHADVMSYYPGTVRRGLAAMAGLRPI